MMQQLAIPVTHSSQVGEVRRAAATIASEIKLGDTDAGRAAIIATEVANNLARYAQGGFILLRGDASPTGATLEILSLDTGPGMDVDRCLGDGFSTSGTPGNGLGAVRRMASDFDAYSIRGAGSAIVATVSNRPAAANAASLRYGQVCLPARGENVCGDTCRIDHRPGVARLMIADGLGHGPDAAKASTAGATAFLDETSTEPTAFLRAAHLAMTGTRGSAVAIAILDAKRSTLRYAGVGNIAGVLFAAASRRGLPSMNGIVGAILPRLQAFDYPLPESGMLIMHSDGLQTRWSLDAYPGIIGRHPALIAGMLYRDFYRGRDDVTVLVASWRGGLS